MIISPANKLSGRIVMPGDKSVSHRAAMLAAVADGESTIENFSSAADCRSTLECLRVLGVDIDHKGSTVIIRGNGLAGFRRPARPLDCGNSGTTMRLMAGLLAGHDLESVLTGDESLLRRPMNRIIEPLARMGSPNIIG
jgi:3-phosphoshikimate 1-carboxyvinyltransferase